MRILLSFLIGLVGFFYIGEILQKVFRVRQHSIPGFLIIVAGFLVGFFGNQYFPPPLSIFVTTFLLGAGLGLIAHHLLSKRYIISENAELEFVKRHATFFERSLEILPGALTWVVLTSPFWLSITLPFAVAYLLIIADVYWLISALKSAVLVYLGYKKIDWAKKQPWLSKLENDFKNQWEDYYHLILLPRYNESLLVIGPAIDAILSSNYPKDRVLLAVGFEERAKSEETVKIMSYLKKHSTTGVKILVTTHPYGLPGEVPGPGTNRNWMVKNAVKEFTKLKIKPENVLVTTLDTDFVIHMEFLAGALYKYLATPKEVRNKRSYTGSFLYYNNYWQTPAPMRMIAVGTAFWQLCEMLSSDKYMNFSSMSINLKSLLDIGLWIPDKVNDDSGFYWKAYYHFEGDYKVLPHFIPISADAVLDVSLLKTMQNQYLQLKRWAYGVEHVPFIFKEYFKRTNIDFWDKTDKLFFALWGYLKWGTLALFVTFGGLIIPLVNPSYKESVLAVNLPIASSWILTAAFLGLTATIYVHEKTVPPRPKDWSIIQRAWSYLQFLLVPLIVVTISAIPSIDAQTSLMFGKYMEFRTTNKARLVSASQKND